MRDAGGVWFKKKVALFALSVERKGVQKTDSSFVYRASPDACTAASSLGIGTPTGAVPGAAGAGMDSEPDDSGRTYSTAAEARRGDTEGTPAAPAWEANSASKHLYSSAVASEAG